ncbi:MAG TPA: DUF3455 domain-containing protein [Terriglobales bacterium]|nr:DUF3455 domain-containing protein [Terriglobales bacterium]
MKYELGQQTKMTARVRSLFVAILALGCFSMATRGVAQNIAFPITPTDITPQSGNVAFLEGHAVGSQGYTCLPTSTGGTAWSTTARPEATLFATFFGQRVQIITHFTSINANPNDFAIKPVPLGGNATWQSSFDSSKVWAVATGHINGGSDASCPNAGAIPCLLLQSVGNQEGPTGGKLLAKTTFVQRLNTKGGAAPTTACTVGQTQLQPYTADYVFFHGSE